MKLRATILGVVISLVSTMAMAQGPVLTGSESSANLAPAAGVNQHKPATIVSQAGETTQDGNTLRLVLLALLVMGSIALRRSRSAR